jgi:GNAT superfamily N-acetyltransferase
LTEIEIIEIGEDDLRVVISASDLFDNEPQPGMTQAFLHNENHHLLIAFSDDDPVGFVSGIEIAHPDKGVEMLLYELGVDEGHRRHGFGTALVEAMVDLAKERGCRGMWVPVEPDNVDAMRVYRAAGAGPPEDATILSWDF